MSKRPQFFIGHDVGTAPRACVVCLICSICSCGVGSAFATTLTSSQLDLATYYIEGMWVARNAVISGEVEYRATITSARSGLSRQEEVALLFQKQGYWQRYELRKANRGVTHIINSSESLLHIHGQPLVSKNTPDAPIHVADSRPLDYRLIGMISLIDYEHRPEYETIYKTYGNANQVVDLQQSGPSVCGITWELSKSDKLFSQRTLWIDSAQGFAPIRMRQDVTVVRESGERVSFVESEGECKWKQVNGHWVPDEWKVSVGNGRRSLDFACNWVLVNAPIDETLFTVKGLNVPLGTKIVDHSLGQPIVEEIAVVQSSPIDQGRASKSRPWFLGVNIAVLFAIVLAYIWRFYHRRKLTSF